METEEFKKIGLRISETLSGKERYIPPKEDLTKALELERKGKVNIKSKKKLKEIEKKIKELREKLLSRKEKKIKLFYNRKIKKIKKEIEKELEKIIEDKKKIEETIKKLIKGKKIDFEKIKEKIKEKSHQEKVITYLKPSNTMNLFIEQLLKDEKEEMKKKILIKEDDKKGINLEQSIAFLKALSDVEYWNKLNKNAITTKEKKELYTPLIKTIKKLDKIDTPLIIILYLKKKNIYSYIDKDEEAIINESREPCPENFMKLLLNQIKKSDKEKIKLNVGGGTTKEIKREGKKLFDSMKVKEEDILTELFKKTKGNEFIKVFNKPHKAIIIKVTKEVNEAIKLFRKFGKNIKYNPRHGEHGAGGIGIGEQEKKERRLTYLPNSHNISCTSKVDEENIIGTMDAVAKLLYLLKEKEINNFIKKNYVILICTWYFYGKSTFKMIQN